MAETGPTTKKYKPTGYANPPEESRFPHGNRQNRGGRPKGAKNKKTTLAEILREEIAVQKEGKRRYVPISDLLVNVVKHAAINGDKNCVSFLSELEGLYGHESTYELGMILLPGDPSIEEFLEKAKAMERDHPPMADDPLCREFNL